MVQGSLCVIYNSFNPLETSRACDDGHSVIFSISSSNSKAFASKLLEDI